MRQRGVAASFDRAAAGYDAQAGLQRAVATELAGHIAALPLPPRPRVLEIGCGTGLLTAALLARLEAPVLLATDIAPAMVRRCAALPGVMAAVMDGRHPAVAAASQDLVCASLVFQWFPALPALLDRLRALLAPGGTIAFSTLGPASLAEWRGAHLAAGVAAPIPAYADPAVLVGRWPGRITLRRTIRRVRHADGLGFLRQLRAIGAAVPREPATPVSAAALRRVLARFETDHAATVTYEIVHVLLTPAHAAGPAGCAGRVMPSTIAP